MFDVISKGDQQENARLIPTQDKLEQDSCISGLAFGALLSLELPFHGYQLLTHSWVLVHINRTRWSCLS